MEGWRAASICMPKELLEVDVWAVAPDGSNGRRIPDVYWNGHYWMRDRGYERTDTSAMGVPMFGVVVTHWRRLPRPPMQLAVAS